MDFTKTKTFIAFVNKDGKNKYWVDGNMPYDEISPKIYPYETKEEKENAKSVGYRMAIWRETGDVEGVLLKVCETMPIITKKEAEAIDEKQARELKAAKEKMLEEDKKLATETPQKKKEKIVEKVPEPIVEKKLEVKIQPPIVETHKKRGRPRLHPLIEE